MTVWTRERLDAVASIERITVNPDQVPPSTPYIGLDNLEKGGRIVGLRTVGQADLASNKFRFTKNNVLFGKLRPYLAKVATPNFDGICSTDILPILPGPRVDRSYLAHFLAFPETISLATTRATGANLPRISPKELSGFEIPIPPIEEQRRIAEVLDRANDLRAKRQQAISLLDDLKQSVFIDMFGDDSAWDSYCRLADVADISSGITKGRKIRQGTALRSVPYLAVANVQDKRLDLSFVKTIEASAGEIERHRLRKDDLLLTEGGDPDKLGRGTLWNEEIADAIHQNHIFRVRLRSNAHVNPVYLNWYVSSDFGKRYFLQSAKQTTGIASINATQLKNFPLRLPSLQLQESFAAKIASVCKSQAVQEANLLALDELIASLQAKAFHGEL